MTTDERLIELEATVAFHEDRLEKANELLSEQQLQLHRLEEELGQLRAHLETISPSMVRSEDEEAPPPHY